MRRQCACGGFISPYEEQRLFGMAYVHRYRCGCRTKFDIMTSFGRFILATLNLVIVAVLLAFPKERFASSSDRMWIFVVVLGIQIPIVAVMLVRSIRNERRYPVAPAS